MVQCGEAGTEGLMPRKRALFGGGVIGTGLLGGCKGILQGKPFQKKMVQL